MSYDLAPVFLTANGVDARRAKAARPRPPHFAAGPRRRQCAWIVPRVPAPSPPPLPFVPPPPPSPPAWGPRLWSPTYRQILPAASSPIPELLALSCLTGMVQLDLWWHLIRPRMWGFWGKFWQIIPCLFFFFLSGDQLTHTCNIFFRPGSVHSGSASWDKCGWAFPDKLCVSSFHTLCLLSIVSPLQLHWIKD